MSTKLDDVFENLGGTSRMTQWASENETEFYKLWSKTIPTKQEVELNTPNKLVDILKGDIE